MRGSSELVIGKRIGAGRCGFRSRGSGESFGHDFFRGGFADGAGGIPDTALRESKFAAACAGVGIEAVKNYLFLFRREFREVYARKFGGAISVCEENLAFVFEGFNSGHNGHAQ